MTIEEMNMRDRNRYRVDAVYSIARFIDKWRIEEIQLQFATLRTNSLKDIAKLRIKEIDPNNTRELKAENGNLAAAERSLLSLQVVLEEVKMKIQRGYAEIEQYNQQIEGELC
jgi:hypothetical protein